LSVVVVESAGPVFCAGFDLDEFQQSDLSERLWASSDRWHETLRSFPLPLLASIQGPAFAGGFDLATMCDLRIAAASATFRRPELAWGVAIYSVVADLVGGAVARELSMTQRARRSEGRCAGREGCRRRAGGHDVGARRGGAACAGGVAHASAASVPNSRSSAAGAGEREAGRLAQPVVTGVRRNTRMLRSVRCT
jgi:hypothetical protein